jgi:hypothetical protein
LANKKQFLLGVSMNYTWRDAPRDIILWACAYATNNSEKGMALKKLPVQGKIIGNGELFYHQSFYETNKLGEIKKSTRVYAESRIYADTYEESVEIYNDLVDKHITFLKGLIEICNNDKIM